MQLSLRKWILLGVVAYLLFAIVTMPARALLNWVGGETLSSSNVRGSAWSGMADSVSNGNMAATDVSWKIKPLSLFTLKAGGSVKARVPGGPFEADVYRSLFGSTITAKSVKAVLDIDEISRVIGKQFLFNGRVGLNLESIKWDGTQISDCHGDVTLVELTETIAGTPVGTFEIKFDGIADNAITGVMSDFNAPFDFDGTFKLGAARSWTLDGLIQPRADTPPRITDALPTIGASRDNQGNYVISRANTY